MRAHSPVRLGTANSTKLHVMVESEVQKQLMESFIPLILNHLRSDLHNGAIEITVDANGESSPMTWNEREVISDIAKRHPILNDFISDLKLTLN